ncbi:MAG: PAS domain-containing protein [Alphaproteobacteria bacterium]
MARTFAELSPDPILVFCPSGQLEACSAAARELTGIVPTDIGSITLAELLGGDNAIANSVLLQALAQKQPTPVRLRLYIAGRAPAELRGECWRLGGEHTFRAVIRLSWKQDRIDKFTELSATIDRLNREMRAKDGLLWKLNEAAAETRRIEARARIGVWRWVVGEPVPRVSDEVLNVLDWPAGKAVPDIRSYLRRVVSADRKRVQHALLSIYREQQAVEVVHDLIAAGGVRCIRLGGEPQQDTRGNVTRIIGYVQDISVEKQAERALKLFLSANQATQNANDTTGAINAILRVLCEATGAVYGESWLPGETENTLQFRRSTWYDASLRYADFREASEGFAFSLGQGVPGRVWQHGRQEWHPNLAELEEPHFMRGCEAAAAGFKAALAQPIADGQQRPFAVLMMFFDTLPVRDKEFLSLASGVAAQASAALKRKMIEDSLHESIARYERAEQGSSAGLWDWDIDTGTVYYSGRFMELLGYPAQSCLGDFEFFASRLHPDDIGRMQDAIAAHRETGRPYDMEYRLQVASGEYRWFHAIGKVSCSPKGTEIMAGSILDVTVRRRAEEELRQSQKMEAVGHLTGGVAHDFNNLLTVILGNAEMLAEMTTDPKMRSMAKMTISAAARGAQLTSRLLAFARRQPLDPKPTDVNQLVEAMQALIRRTLPESIDLDFVPDPDLGITEIDAGELDTALLNLVVNARDAMQESGKLTIETANVVLDSEYAAHHMEVVPGEYVMVCVSDTGSGMDPETVRRAFEPFFTTKEVGKGSGLGLSMVFGFTKQSGGHIKIYSEPGEGTSVKLYFPRIQAGKVSGSQPTAEAPPPVGSEHILIAEDDDLVLEHLKNQLLLLGYRVTTAMSGPEALSVLQAHDDIDLLLTDVVMPGGMNGRELADRARSARPSLKVMFTSGYTENAIVHHGRLDSGVALLSKPYTRLELATKLRSVLGSE